MDLGLSAINLLDEISAFSTLANRILHPLDGFHWSVSDHVFGVAIAVVISAKKSDHDKNYKTELQIWK